MFFQKQLLLAVFASSCCISQLSAQCCPDASQGPMGPQGPIGTPGLVGPQGPMGPQGVDGATGDPGTNGIDGIQGPQGVQGPIGPQGVQGPIGPQGGQGIQGLVGPCCAGIYSYANVYTSANQTIDILGNPNNNVLFESANAVSSDFDVTLTPTAGTILCLRSGIYQIDYTVQGLLTNLVFPTPPFSFGLYSNGTLIPGSVISGASLAIDETLNHTNGSVTIQITMGDLISLQNVSTAPFNIVSVPPIGSSVPGVGASINMSLVQPL